MLHAPTKVHRSSWEDVADLSARCGVVLDEWQEVVLQAAMGERHDGKWATSQVGVSAPRQQGKSQLIVARALAGVLLFDEQTIICSAHQQDTAREVFTRLLDILQDSPSLDARVESYGRALNREYIRFKSGQVIRFKARSAGGGRGFSCDCLLLDEAQILSPAAWAAILPTMSARPNPQVWLFGTPPTPQDDGEVFGRIRSAGLEGKSSRLAYLEWSAEPTDDLDDPAVWAKANPAFGSRISYEAVADERAAMSDDQFAMERLGMWDEVTGQQVIPRDTWDLRTDESSMPVDTFSLAVGVNPDRSSASVGFVGQRADGSWHVEVDEQRKGVDWVAPYVQARVQRNQIRAVVVNGSSPAASVAEDLANLRVHVTLLTAQQVAASFAMFYDAVMSGSMVHMGQPQLTAALTVARKRELAGGSAWSQKNSASDITPLEACTFALWGAQASKVKRPGTGRASTGDRSSNGNRTGTVS